MRFEKPNPKQRWDNPCFTVTPDTDLSAVSQDVANSLFNLGKCGSILYYRTAY